MIDLDKQYDLVKGTDDEDEFVDELFSLQGKDVETDKYLSKFYLERIKNYSSGDNIGYIFNAISYALISKDRKGSEEYLRAIIDNPVRYKDIGSQLGAAAATFGGLVAYPDPSLKRVLETDFSDIEADRDTYSHFINRAYGAYIATATDFEYGLKSAQELDGTGKTPTLEEAEKKIAEYPN